MKYQSNALADYILNWILWTLTLALILGGTPWSFPQSGRLWLHQYQPSQLNVNAPDETAQSSIKSNTNCPKNICSTHPK